MTQNQYSIISRQFAQIVIKVWKDRNCTYSASPTPQSSCPARACFLWLRKFQDFEVAKTGLTSLWARGKAIAYKCVVIAGYAEKDEKKSDSPVYYNSAIVVNEDVWILGRCVGCENGNCWLMRSGLVP
ncbi:hypothetical protein DL98DRAFT_595272 [Cadophora sp. DSE1049]|nr:hypothetical protein DL98DRAFT_595272 [Cadophora sp. DSE1049]